MDDLQTRLRRLESDERSRWSSGRTRLVVVVLLAGLGAVLYFMNKQDKKNIQENGVLLPTLLIHKASAARRDLALLNRDLAELAKEIDKSLSGTPGDRNRKKGDRYIVRLHDLHRLGNTIEPRLTREEQRVLIATEHAEKLIEQFILGACGVAMYDHKLIETAHKQIARAQALARGEATDAVLSGDGPKGGVIGGIKSLATNLEQIKKLKDGQPRVPQAAAYVPEIDGPRPEAKHGHKKKRKTKHKE